MTALIPDALRNLSRMRRSAAAAVLVLGTGIGASAGMFALLDAVILERLPYPQADRLLQIWSSDPAQGTVEESLSFGEYELIAARSRSFDGAAFYSFWFPTVTANGKREQVKVARSSSNLFDVMGVAPAQGGGLPATPLPFVVLSHSLAERLYGTSERLPERAIVLDGVPFTPIGVMPRGFSFPSDADAWAPAGLRVTTNPPPRDGFIVARLKPGMTLDVAATELSSIAKMLPEVHPDLTAGHRLRAVPLQRQLSAVARSVVLVLFGSVMLFFVISCTSAAQLLYVANLGRQTELAIRTALGASRRRIVAQLFVESVAVTTLGTIVGALLAAWIVDVANGFVPQLISGLPAVAVGTRVLWFMTALGAFAASGVALASGWQLTAGDPAAALKGGRRAGEAKAGATRAALLCFATAAILALTIGAVSVVVGLWRITRTDLGLNPNGVFTSRLCTPPEGPGSDGSTLTLAFDRMAESLSAISGIRSVAMSDQLPLGSYTTSEIFVEGVPGYPEVRVQAVSSEYFRALEIPILEGGSFERERTAGAQRVAIVNEAFRNRFWPGKSAVGQRFQGAWDDERRWITIVGVSRSVRRSASDQEASLQVFLPLFQQADTCGFLLVSIDAGARLTGSRLRGHLWDVGGRHSLSDVTSLGTFLRNQRWQPRLRAIVLGSFAALALIFGAIALYATLTQLVSARRRELAIRAALGATPSELARVVLATHIRPISLGMFLGASGSFLANRWLWASVVSFERVDSTSVVVVCAVLAVTAFAATIGPALRACKIDGLPALRDG